MKRYTHTQVGWLNLLSLGLSAIFCSFWVATIPGPFKLIPLGVAILMFILLLLFYSMRIEVEEERIHMTMGLGVIKKQWLLADAASARAVKTRLIEGWGIKLTKDGWLYSVSIPDAVHITMNEGKAVILGTDEPTELLEALAQAGLEIEQD